MHGLDVIGRLNDLEAAQAHRRRYEKLRDRAIKRADWARAQRYDGYFQDFTRFLLDEISVFPDRQAREEGLFSPSVGKQFPAKQKEPNDA